jgi:tRNA (guanine-N7-)-methyltransferase
MGRRTLRKIDPAIDLSSHFFDLDQLPQPWDAQKLFGRVAPLEVEIGTGKGLFLETAATKLPEHNFLGIEVSRKYARFTAARLASHELPNARAVHGDGLRLFHEMLPENGVTAVHVYFPDPWWKRRHRRRRVLNDQFLHDVMRVLKPKGQLHFWTDVKEYYDTTLERITQLREGPLKIAPTSFLEGPLDVPERPAEHTLDYCTHFERRTRLQEAPVYRSVFVKQEP